MNGNDWPDKYPWRLLPRGGSHPFVPPKGIKWPSHPKRGMQNGYLDQDNNDWVPHQPISGREEDFHWNVQHPDGGHTNIGPDGEVHHGDDNFP